MKWLMADLICWSEELLLATPDLCVGMNYGLRDIKLTWKVGFINHLGKGASQRHGGSNDLDQ